MRQGNRVATIRYDKLKLDQVDWQCIDGVVISPGPYTPSNYPKHFELYEAILGKTPILGVCLGFQSIGEYFGAKLTKAQMPMHGKVSEIEHSGEAMFEDLKSPTKVTRYHSLILSNLPNVLKPIAYTTKNELMAYYNDELKVWSVQFHPEAVLTTYGVEMIANWLKKINSFKKLKTENAQLSVQ
jgi:anthranilate synthase/aminodeoxychorismate synthase-like glutamine amidotransferase